MTIVRKLEPMPPPEGLTLEAVAALGAEILTIQTDRRTWDWQVRKSGFAYLATLSTADYRPLEQGACFAGVGGTPAEALKAARMNANTSATNAVRGFRDR